MPPINPDLDRVHNRIDNLAQEVKEGQQMLDRDIKGLRAQFTQHIMEGVQSSKEQIKESANLRLYVEREITHIRTDLNEGLNKVSNKLDPLVQTHLDEANNAKQFRKHVINILIATGIGIIATLLLNGMIHTGEQYFQPPSTIQQGKTNG